MKHILISLSPSGGTKKVVDKVAETLTKSDQNVLKLDLYRNVNLEAIADTVNGEKEKCLWFFTPVYADHPLPQIMDIITSLRTQKTYDSNKTFAVIIASWGGVSSGLALYDMYNELRSKNIPVLGASKVLAEHSSMWKSPKPLNQHKPDKNDLGKIHTLTYIVLDKLSNPPVQGIDFSVLDYQTDKMKKEAEQKNLEITKQILPPKIADKTKCTLCGKCIEICPVFALEYNPYPKANSNCILCNNCVKVCPENAFAYDHKRTEERIYQMAKDSDEPKTTAIFT